MRTAIGAGVYDFLSTQVSKFLGVLILLGRHNK